MTRRKQNVWFLILVTCYAPVGSSIWSPFAAARKTIVAQQGWCAALFQALKTRLTGAIYCKMLATRGLVVRLPNHWHSQLTYILGNDDSFRSRGLVFKPGFIIVIAASPSRSLVWRVRLLQCLSAHPSTGPSTSPFGSPSLSVQPAWSQQCSFFNVRRLNFLPGLRPRHLCRLKIIPRHPWCVPINPSWL